MTKFIYIIKRVIYNLLVVPRSNSSSRSWRSQPLARFVAQERNVSASNRLRALSRPPIIVLICRRTIWAINSYISMFKNNVIECIIIYLSNINLTITHNSRTFEFVAISIRKIIYFWEPSTFFNLILSFYQHLCFDK